MLLHKSTIRIFAFLAAWGCCSIFYPGQQVQAQSPQSETRAYQVIIDHYQQTITIQASFYPAHGQAAEWRQVQAGVAFWNNASGTFHYISRKSADSWQYEIRFNLIGLYGYWDENDFFLPASGYDHRYLTSVALVAPEQLARISASHPAYQVIGYAPNHHIYISEAYADEYAIGMHEMGHRIGAGHTNRGIMSHALGSLTNRISKETVKSLLVTAGIWPYRYRPFMAQTHKVKPAYLKTIGQAPLGFWQHGKVSKHTKAP